MMTDEYKEIDKLLGISIEPGDLIKLPNNDVVSITRVDPTANGYALFFLDIFEDEELSYEIGDDQFVSLLQFD